MKKLIEKRAALAALLASMLDAVKQEERAFTEEEDKKFAETEAEIAAIDKTIEAEKRAEGLQTAIEPEGKAAETKPEDFLAEMQTELDSRIQNYNDFLAANS